MKILVIEDNNILRDNLDKYLTLKWYSVDTHASYSWAVHKIVSWKYDLIILDLSLWEWEWDGLNICQEARNTWNITPVLMLTARTLIDQKVEWLDAGADDYMTKPFDYKELLARVQALTRREKQHKWDMLQHNNICIHKQKREVLKDNIPVSLSKLEYDLLLYLLENKWISLKKETIIEDVWWDIDLFENSRKLDIYIGYLRKKIDKNLIETIHGIWYIIPS